jgi:hypothetical protein
VIPPDVQRELAALERRIRELETGSVRARSDVRAEIDGMIAGIRAHVDGSIRAALMPYLERIAKLDQIAADQTFLKEAAEEARKYRAKREAREELLAERKLEAEAEKIEAEAAIVAIEAKRRYRVGLLTVAGVVIAAFFGLIGAAIGSHH